MNTNFELNVKICFITLNKRETCDLELILNKGFDPLMDQLRIKKIISHIENMRLSNNKLWQELYYFLSINEIKRKS